MKKQKIHCVVVGHNAVVSAALDSALRHSDELLELESVTSAGQIIPVLKAKKPHLLFCPYIKSENAQGLLRALQRYSPDTLLVWVSRKELQGLTTWLLGVESCTLPVNDMEYFSQYLDFLLHYSAIKHEFRQCKRLLGVAELRCHWLVDYSWEPIAYIFRGMHLYANHAYVSVLGFESVDETRSMPVTQLVDKEERRTFESLYNAAELSNKPSNRLLTTLRTLDGSLLRAEVRFIPAVLKGQRCLQLHVHPLEKPLRSRARQKQVTDPWNGEATKLIETVSSDFGASSPTGNLPAGMRQVFQKAMKLVAALPDMLFSEPKFRHKDGRVSTYKTMVQKLSNTDSRFRLDYWNIGQSIRKLTLKGMSPSGYQIFVSVGAGILGNQNHLKRLVELLNAHPQASKYLVIGLDYRDCMSHAMSLGKVCTLLKATGARIAIDSVTDESQTLSFIQAVKPAFVRITPEMAVNVSKHAGGAARLQKLIRQLATRNTQVIVSGVDDATSLNLACATPAAYLQGEILERK
jgi:EAL domain-containing protein (putative c-di-GMP-specific phosphodiesterase class I)